MARNGINVKGVSRTIRNVSRFRRAVTKGGNGKYVVGVGVEYGAYVEFGTSKMKAQPYLEPAARKVLRTEIPRLEKKADNVDDLVKLVAEAISAEAKRNAPVGKTGNLKASIHVAPAEAMK